MADMVKAHPCADVSTPADNFSAQFDFSLSYDHWHPVVLAHPYPRMSEEGRRRLDEVKSRGCRCKVNICTQATLRKRSINGAVTVWLQCDACGGAVGSSSLARKEHYNWQDYPEWDNGLKERYDALHRDHIFSRAERITAERAEAFAQRRAEYAEWMRNSEVWSNIRERVLWRSRGWCEACLVNQADNVHHVTYQQGKLPPAWELRAVCHDCHGRLHDADDAWCLPGMGR